MKLFILGNGFDIAHEIPSKYSDFYQYIENHNPEILIRMENFYYIDKNSTLWSDFENGLMTEINYDRIVDIISENSPYFSSDFSSDGFRDRDWYTAQQTIEEESNCVLKDIKLELNEWVLSLSTFSANQIYKLDKTSYFITFNYTDVLEQVYDISESNILHIHNKVGEELIFGHGEKSEDINIKKLLYGNENAFLTRNENGEIESTEIGHEYYAESALNNYLKTIRKPTENIIQKQSNFFRKISNTDEIIVLGHSYNKIDYPYFEKIKDSVNSNTKWVLYYFSKEDKIRAEQMTKHLRINDLVITYKSFDKMEKLVTRLVY